MPETSTPTLTPDGTTKFPAFQNNNPGNVEVDALKAYILSQAGLANGLATLDENGKLNSSQIPVNLDDVLVYDSYASLPATGETGKLYITMDVNGSYYWNGTSYQILNQSFVRYRGSLSSLPSDPQPGDWFIAASSFSSYTSGHIYLYNGSSWDDVTAVFGQFVLKTDIAQNLGQQTDKVPSNKAVDDAINAIGSTVASKLGTLYLTPYDGKYLDLNDSRFLDWGRITTFGWDFSSSERVSNSPKSGASAMSGFCIAFTDYAIQFAWDYTGYAIYYRTHYNNGWNGWKQLTVTSA